MQRIDEVRPDLPVTPGAPPAPKKGPRPGHARFDCPRASRQVPA
jgi:hypothetical protein